jgi:hypothetical protein
MSSRNRTKAMTWDGTATMTTREETLATTDRQALWTWVADSVRATLGWILLALGALAIFLGWYGVSGQSLPAKQLPYLISGGLTGLGLIVVGSVVLATAHLRRQLARLDDIERKMDDLYDLLVLEPPPAETGVASAGTLEPGTAAGTAADESGGTVALPSGSTFHRASCPLVTGKAAAVTVDEATLTARALEPCPVCDPRGAGEGG